MNELNGMAFVEQPWDTTRTEWAMEQAMCECVFARRRPFISLNIPWRARILLIRMIFNVWPLPNACDSLCFCLWALSIDIKKRKFNAHSVERVDAYQFSVAASRALEPHIPHDHEASFSYQFQTILKIFTTHQTDQIPNDERTNEQNGIGYLKMPLHFGCWLCGSSAPLQHHCWLAGNCMLFKFSEWILRLR